MEKLHYLPPCCVLDGLRLWFLKAESCRYNKGDFEKQADANLTRSSRRSSSKAGMQVKGQEARYLSHVYITATATEGK